MSPTDDDASECATKNPPVNSAMPSSSVASQGVAASARPAMAVTMAASIASRRPMRCA